jgi:hypothetical protein
MYSTFPNTQELDNDARLAQDLQLAAYQEQQRSQAKAEESTRKFREEMFGNIRNNAAAKRKWREEKLNKLRFDYAEARRYSLERKLSPYLQD